MFLFSIDNATCPAITTKERTFPGSFDIILDMKISIIGAGYAGLSSTLFLSRHKLNQITLYDKFDTVQTIGAGILIQPSAMEVLKKLDLYEDLINRGEKVYYLEGINHRGRQVFLTSYNDYAPNCFGIGIHRSVLFKSLYDKCKLQPNVHFALNHVFVRSKVEKRSIDRSERFALYTPRSSSYQIHV